MFKQGRLVLRSRWVWFPDLAGIGHVFALVLDLMGYVECGLVAGEEAFRRGGWAQARSPAVLWVGIAKSPFENLETSASDGR